MPNPQTEDDILNPHPWPPPYAPVVAIVTTAVAFVLSLLHGDFVAATFSGIAFFSLAYYYMQSRGGSGRTPGSGTPTGRPGGTVGGGGAPG